MDFRWEYRYVSGGVEPDKFNRWRLDCYVFINIEKALPQYNEAKELYENFMPTRIVSINQKGTHPGYVPSVEHKFCASMISFEEAGNLGLMTRNYFSNDLEELKKIVEENLIKLQIVFANIK